jgi:uncharacterized protein with PIN domain
MATPRCARCGSPERPVMPSPQEADLEPERRGSLAWLGRCRQCRALWHVGATQPYTAGEYAVPWALLPEEWQELFARDQGVTLVAWQFATMLTRAREMEWSDASRVLPGAYTRTADPPRAHVKRGAAAAPQEHYAPITDVAPAFAPDELRPADLWAILRGEAAWERPVPNAETERCPMCGAPDRPFISGSPNREHFRRTARGMWHELWRCRHCRALWQFSPYEPYLAFTYGMPWRRGLLAWWLPFGGAADDLANRLGRARQVWPADIEYVVFHLRRGGCPIAA